MKTTADKILDAAEGLFAEKGYKATSLGDVADRVGIRSPSLYNHFRNKEALYMAVLERLVGKFTSPLMELLEKPITRASVIEWLETILDLHFQNPNLARLLQHAALAGGPGTRGLVERMFKPLFEHAPPPSESGLHFFGGSELEPWAIMAFNNIVMSYITMAPMYQDILGMDPFSEEAIAKQRELVIDLIELVVQENRSSAETGS